MRFAIAWTPTSGVMLIRISSAGCARDQRRSDHLRERVQRDRAWQVPNSLQTRFQIASLSKPMTAAAILLLAEERKLSLEDKLSKFVPDFPNGDKITVEELLTHYSGLGDASAQPDYNEWSRFPQTTAALVERAKKFPGKVSRAQPTSIVTRTITFWLS